VDTVLNSPFVYHLAVFEFTQKGTIEFLQILWYVCQVKINFKQCICFSSNTLHLVLIDLQVLILTNALDQSNLPHWLLRCLGDGRLWRRRRKNLCLHWLLRRVWGGTLYCRRGQGGSAVLGGETSHPVIF